MVDVSVGESFFSNDFAYFESCQNNSSKTTSLLFSQSKYKIICGSNLILRITIKVTVSCTIRLRLSPNELVEK